MPNRRDLLKSSIIAGFIGSVPVCRLSAAGEPEERPGSGKIDIVDTNVSLFHWPFRRLPLDETAALVEKLQSLGVTEAWASSFEALLHRDMAGVNQRLADECQKYSMLVPVGAINLNLPNWDSDFELCITEHSMPGIRLFPSYHLYRLDDRRCIRLFEMAVRANCFVQIVATLEDERTQHSRLMTANVDLGPLPTVVQQVPGLRVQILNERPRGGVLDALSAQGRVYFDTARVESTDGVPELVKQLSSGRVLYGSHAPFLVPEAALIRTQESSRLNRETLRTVLSSNARAFMGQDSKSGFSTFEDDDTSRFSQGLPKPKQLADYRIWDSYFTPSHAHPGTDGTSRLLTDIERAMPAIQAGRFERLCYFAHVGLGTTQDNQLEKLLQTNPALVLAPLAKYPNLLLGMIQLNANDVPKSLDAIRRWLRDGPMRGVYFSGTGPGALNCADRNVDALVEEVAKLDGVIMQHTWFNTLGKQHPGASTPEDLVELASRFPEKEFLCAHAGGEWQQGIRAVRDSENILVETSGFDASAGFIEMAVRELGAHRIVFGSHLPSRSLGTELAKVIGTEIAEADKQLILGGNYRRLLGAD
ncbi:MAG: amidohydrolase family protein [Planctomycetales bacterium]|nr:amidohydrolase family protein [Planctomycetales bacterium]